MQKKFSSKKPEKRRHGFLHFLLVCLALFFGAAAVGLYKAPAILRSADVAQKADAIVVLGGGPLRAIYGAELYRQGIAPLVYISQPFEEITQKRLREIGVHLPAQEDLYREVLVKSGVPADRIRVFGRSVSTAQEAVQIRKLFPKGPCTLVVVTSPYHSRRAGMIFRDTVTECRILAVGDPNEPYPDAWWRDQDAARNTLLEIVKVIFYQLGGRYLAGPV